MLGRGDTQLKEACELICYALKRTQPKLFFDASQREVSELGSYP